MPSTSKAKRTAYGGLPITDNKRNVTLSNLKRIARNSNNMHKKKLFSLNQKKADLLRDIQSGDKYFHQNITDLDQLIAKDKEIAHARKRARRQRPKAKK